MEGGDFRLVHSKREIARQIGKASEGSRIRYVEVVAHQNPRPAAPLQKIPEVLHDQPRAAVEKERNCHVARRGAIDVQHQVRQQWIFRTLDQPPFLVPRTWPGKIVRLRGDDMPHAAARI